MKIIFDEKTNEKEMCTKIPQIEIKNCFGKKLIEIKMK